MRLAHSNDAAPSLRELASWQFVSSGNFEADCARGRGLARSYLEQVGADGFANILQYMVASLVARGTELGGLEIGFLTQLARQLSPASSTAAPPLTLCSA